MSKNCEVCGNDLYNENNILLEAKATVDACLEDVIPENLGRPMYAIIIGDTGLCIVNSPMFNGGDDILIECLRATIDQLKRKPRIRYKKFGSE